jgi:hypothetical protein
MRNGAYELTLMGGVCAIAYLEGLQAKLGDVTDLLNGYIIW